MFIFAWIPTASAGETDPAVVATAEAIKEGASRLSAAKAAAYAEETMTKEELMVKAASLEQELERYKTAAKELQIAENTPISVKYLGQENRLNGNQEVTEYLYVLHGDKRHAALAIKTATAETELGFVNLRLSRIAGGEFPCHTKDSRCKSAMVKWQLENAQAQESYKGTLREIRMFVP